MDASEVLRRLQGLGPAPVVEAVTLALRLKQAPPDEAELVELQPRLEAALDALHKQVKGTEGLRKRCESLRATPARRTPPGF